MQGLSQRTVVFLLNKEDVLLGYKKTGFGKGNYLGIGGKIESGESEMDAITREMYEEIGVTKPALQKVGNFTFLFPEKPDWSQQVHSFICQKWEGTPTESDEIKPEWVNKQKLPLSQMWDDAQFWLPAILNGHSLSGVFTFNTELKVVKIEMSEAGF